MTKEGHMHESGEIPNLDILEVVIPLWENTLCIYILTNTDEFAQKWQTVLPKNPKSTDIH